MAGFVCSSGGSGRASRRGFDRQHPHEGASLGGRRKRGAFAQAIGISRGGRNSKLHALTDGEGRPLRFLLTGGQVADCRAAVSRIPRDGADHDAERHAADLDRKLDDIDGFVRTVDSLAEHYLHAERQSIGQLFAALEAMR